MENRKKDKIVENYSNRFKDLLGTDKLCGNDTHLVTESIGESINESESPRIDKLVELLNYSITRMDGELSYEELAIAVARLIKEEYGDHNIKPFLDTLTSELTDGDEGDTNEVIPV